jgi:hypothetical protein
MTKEIYSSIIREQESLKRNINTNNFIKEIREFFYDGDERSYYIEKDISELDKEKLSNILERYDKFLGF